MSKINTAQRERVTHLIKERSGLSWSYVFMNLLATVIACYGLFSDSPATVIGAMILAMLLNPLMGVALALMHHDYRLLRKSVTTLLTGAVLVYVVALLIGLLHYDLEMTQSITDQTKVNLFSLIIALAGGAAGAYATASPKLLGAFVGVALATTLMPPIAAAGILSAHGEWSMVFEALFLVFVNVIAIQFAMSAVLWVNGFRKVTRKEGVTIWTFLWRNALNVIVLVLLGVFFLFNLRETADKQLFQTQAQTVLQGHVADMAGDELVDVSFEYTDNATIVIAEVYGPRFAITPQQVGNFEADLPEDENGRKPTLRVRYVHVQATDKNGNMFPDSGTLRTE